MNISIENLTKAYGKRIVLDIDSLSFISGKLYAIVGSNGAGKTTLLKIIAGLEHKTEGSITYNESPLNKHLLKNVTYMSQRPYMLRTSVFNNIAYPLKIRKYPKKIIENRVHEIMVELELTDLKDQMATSLSGGESQKVALARALVFEAELLLLDEPTSNINPNAIELIEKVILKRYQEKHMTTIIITHNMKQAKRLCDQMVVIEKGKVKENKNVNHVIVHRLLG